MPPLKILIVDDVAANAKFAEAVVRHLGHVPLLAGNGEQALARFDADTPDLVLMDVMMPVMDGIAATAEIRRRPREREKWTPILLLSALGEVGDIVRGLEAGADDYIVKPVSVPLLAAKIGSFARLIGMQEQVRGYTRELEEWRAEAKRQASLGAHVMGRLINPEALRDAAVHHFNIPAETFSGDLICAARTPDDVLHLLLADATGHGLPAALSAIPLAHAFYGMTEKGFPLASIAKEMNAKLKAFLPADRFVAATLVALDINEQSIEVWNGGNPAALLLDVGGGVVQEWPSIHPPLGILPPALFSERTETIAYQEDCALLLCSDGLVEAEDTEGRRLDRAEWLAALSPAGPRLGLERLHARINAHIAGTETQDDISCILARVPTERRQAPRLGAAEAGREKAREVSEWRLELSYGATELRYLDVVPAALGLLCQVQALQPHQGALFLIVSELFNNALDHGLLGLDSTLKGTDGGFEQYLKSREAGLARLAGGRIDLRFRLHLSDGGPALDIAVADTGAGFDYAPYLKGDGNPLDPGQAHGRGIALVRKLCASVAYTGRGNAVAVRYLV